MNSFEIVTDSSCDLPAELVQELDIQVVPLGFLMEGKPYRNYPDNREMSPEIFYQKLKDGAAATTNAVNLAQATEAIEPFVKAGRDVLVLAFSSGLSATCQAFCLAAEELSEQYPDRKILVVDTLCASLGQGMFVYQAAQQRAQGKSLEEVRDWAEANKLRQCHWFTVNDLFFLKRGGRVSGATALLGTCSRSSPSCIWTTRATSSICPRPGAARPPFSPWPTRWASWERTCPPRPCSSATAPAWRTPSLWLTR